MRWPQGLGTGVLMITFAIVVGLVAFGMGRIVTEDAVFRTPIDSARFWLEENAGAFGAWVGRLLECLYCVGLWFAAFTTLALVVLYDAPTTPAWLWWAVVFAAGRGVAVILTFVHDVSLEGVDFLTKRSAEVDSSLRQKATEAAAQRDTTVGIS
jgi:hypothetical protein